MGRNFDDYSGFQPFRSWANTYEQDCISLPVSVPSRSCIDVCKANKTSASVSLRRRSLTVASRRWSKALSDGKESKDLSLGKHGMFIEWRNYHKIFSLRLIL